MSTTSLTHLPNNEHWYVQNLTHNPDYITDLLEIDSIQDFEAFRKELSLYLLGEVGDAKRGFLHALHLINDHWQKDSAIEPRHYAGCLAQLGKGFLKVGEPELARDSLLLALNIGFSSRYEFIPEETLSRRDTILQLVHVYKAFPRLFAEKMECSFEFIENLGSEGLTLTHLKRDTYASVQKSCSILTKDEAQIKALCHISENTPLFEISFQSPRLFKALLVLNRLGKEEPFDFDAYPDAGQIHDIFFILQNGDLEKDFLEFYRDLYHLTPPAFRNPDAKVLYDEAKWESFEIDALEILKNLH